VPGCFSPTCNHLILKAFRYPACYQAALDQFFFIFRQVFGMAGCLFGDGYACFCLGINQTYTVTPFCQIFLRPSRLRLHSMRERTGKIEVSFKVESEPEKGTRVSLCLKLSNNYGMGIREHPVSVLCMSIC